MSSVHCMVYDNCFASRKDSLSAAQADLAAAARPSLPRMKYFEWKGGGLHLLAGASFASCVMYYSLYGLYAAA